jgi:phospholipase C
VKANRRSFLQLLGAGAASASLPASIARALEIPANNRTRSIRDVEHIVVLMQENRAFDHYFGTMRGVRGFADPRAVKLPNGDPVWYQPNGSGGYVAPYRPDNAGNLFIADVDHGWNSGHVSWNSGNYDEWIPAKGDRTMIHMNRADLPWHYALADAFTICDAYYCSLLGPTDPNRYHMFSGWVGNDGNGGGPVIDNAEAGYDWHTFPERLVQAGISWKVYQDKGLGLDAADFWGWGPPYIGNYGDNSLLYFHQYQNADPGSPLFEGALTGTDIKNGGTLFDQFRADVASGNLPKISYVVAPEAYTEHPNWVPKFGAWYASQFLDILTAHPDVWSKTIFLYTWDENGGFFDHMVPPTPPPSAAQGKSTVPTTNELFGGNATNVPGPYGFGVRVPMLVVSPWSKGGYVSSEVFDHTSIIKLTEARWADQHPEIVETNITPWRRAVAGDLTSAFDFRSPNTRSIALPDTAAWQPPNQNTYPSVNPLPPSNQSVPKQEPGTRPARPVPYELSVRGEAGFANGTFTLHFANEGKAAVLQVRSGNSTQGPWTYTVGHNAQLSDTYTLTAHNLTGYDLSVYGPNGFFRAFKGSITGTTNANLDVRTSYGEESNSITLHGRNLGSKAVTINLINVYTGEVLSSDVAAGAEGSHTFHLNSTHGWYDFVIEVAQDPSFRYQLAGHVETGDESRSDPALSM